MAEQCWICEDKTRGMKFTGRKVSKADDAPLCNRHWNWWLAKYLWPSEIEPPCNAHLIEESGEDDARNAE
ncbi:hypothetical protein FB385_2665 [Paramicrobacterium agarici]|nr:hypothetical protein FB385_2665 [Microbacterium agarici]